MSVMVDVLEFLNIGVYVSKWHIINFKLVEFS